MSLKSTRLRIEPEYAATYAAWTSNPNPKTLSALLHTLRPALEQGIHLVLRQPPSPRTLSMAKKIAIDALRSYDPYRAGLRTHIISNLRGLNRLARKNEQILRVPERVAAEQGWMSEVQEELRNELGREPSMGEVADRMGISRKRLARLRTYSEPLAEGYFAGLQTEEGGGPLVPPTLPGQADFERRRKQLYELIYDDLDGRQQAVLEWSTGLNGRRVLPITQIAKKLGVTPGMVSQIRKDIEDKLRQAEELFP